jgi:hypothetical protein
MSSALLARTDSMLRSVSLPNTAVAAASRPVTVPAARLTTMPFGPAIALVVAHAVEAAIAVDEVVAAPAVEVLRVVTLSLRPVIVSLKFDPRTALTPPDDVVLPTDRSPDRVAGLQVDGHRPVALW